MMQRNQKETGLWTNSPGGSFSFGDAAQNGIFVKLSSTEKPVAGLGANRGK